MVIHSFEELRQREPLSNQIQTVGVVGAESDGALASILNYRRHRPLNIFLIGQREPVDALIKRHPGLGNLQVVYVDTPEEAAAKAVELVKAGQINLLMKDQIATGKLLQSVVAEAGIKKAALLSHLAVLESPYYPKLLFLTDSGMLPVPTIAEKIQLTKTALGFLKKLGYAPCRAAILAPAEVVQPKIPASLAAAAVKAALQETPDVLIDGPLSLDLAVNPTAVTKKKYQSAVAGQADLLVVPDLTAGNLLGKALTSLGGAKMAGIILGAEVPIVLTSRAAAAEEKENSLFLAAL
ncbi:phosphate acyltransferase [Enterococcus sp. HY326]|uniref:phosphate acyltransferase n=1 Tax=Enterococcus sp. HY326 TaxID=2971265 RepID=UPI00223FC15D|nr:phosphate acyltransferase [Enterococcus sp. HY326]